MRIRGLQIGAEYKRRCRCAEWQRANIRNSKDEADQIEIQRPWRAPACGRPLPSLTLGGYKAEHRTEALRQIVQLALSSPALSVVSDGLREGIRHEKGREGRGLVGIKSCVNR